MKKRYIALQLCIVLILLVLPTFSSVSDSSFDPLFNFSFYSLLQLFIALLFDIEYRVFLKPKDFFPFKNSFFLTVNHLKYLAITLGLLMLSYAFMTSLSIFLPQAFSESSQNTNLPKASFSGIIFLALNVFSASYYEEVIYRQLIPESIIYFSNKKAVKIIAEFFSLSVFSFGHFYLGLIAVLNAFVCGIFLRLTRIKTYSVTTGTFSHFIYNFTLFIFMLLLEV